MDTLDKFATVIKVLCEYFNKYHLDTPSKNY